MSINNTNKKPDVKKKSGKKIKLNLGSGIVVKKGFINVDLYDPEDLKLNKGSCKNAVWEKGGKYVRSDIRNMPFDDDFADVVELFEVLEHMPFRTVIPALKEIRRVMKPGAVLYMHMPNFDGLMKDWIDLLTHNFDPQKYIDVMETIYGNQLAGGEFHQNALNPQMLNWYLTEAGFTDGKMHVVGKHSPIPSIGSEKFNDKTVARNELLMAEVRK